MRRVNLLSIVFRLLVEDEMKNLVTWFEYQHQAKSYDRHFLNVNFTRFQRYPLFIELFQIAIFLMILSNLINLILWNTIIGTQRIYIQHI